jgi:putative ATP-dependent endonuclease of OLD family
MRIECIFKNLRDNEAFHFTEWLGMEGEGEMIEPYLRMILDIRHNGERILPFEVRAGVDDIGDLLTAEARDYLKATYLKPLRDTQHELIPKRNSRLSQILEGHEIFKGKTDDHKLKDISRCFNCLIQKYFNRDYSSKNCKCERDSNCELVNYFFDKIKEEDGQLIRKSLNDYIHNFLGNSEINTKFGVISPKLKNILELLKLSYDEEFDPGLGSQNLLFIASELLNLDRSNWSGLRLGLIEELEAHLHPQAQLRVVECLQKFIEDKKREKKDIQFILSTHSPNLGSKIKLKNLIICSDNEVFPMGHSYTELEENDYSFLQRFLDVTKANLFFAKGVILVEGWAEELFLPILAKKIGFDLIQKGISIVNVGGIAFLRYAKIFCRKGTKRMKIPVAVITDLDVKPNDKKLSKNDKTRKEIVTEKKIKKYDGQSVKTFISPYWTFEYCIASSDILRKLFYKSVLLAFKEQKDYQGDEINEKINEVINGVETQFNYWSEDNIPLKIYLQILGEEKILSFPKTKISKPIIAQHFANLLNVSEDKFINKKNLEKDINIKYLINAIKYAAGENSEDTDKR